MKVSSDPLQPLIRALMPHNCTLFQSSIHSNDDDDGEYCINCYSLIINYTFCTMFNQLRPFITQHHTSPSMPHKFTLLRHRFDCCHFQFVRPLRAVNYDLSRHWVVASELVRTHSCWMTVINSLHKCCLWESLKLSHSLRSANAKKMLFKRRKALSSVMSLGNSFERMLLLQKKMFSSHLHL